MHRISIIINEIYQKFLPIAERSGITINLSCPDPSIEVEDPDQLRADLEESLNSALSRTSAHEIQISVDRYAITITDPETILSKTACALLSRSFLTIDSRVGFGTTISIALHRPSSSNHAEIASKTPNFPPETSKSLSEASEAPAKVLAPKDPAPTPKPAKTASKSPKKHILKPKTKKSAPKLSKNQRQLNRAAKKADRKVQKLAKKAKKQTKQPLSGAG